MRAMRLSALLLFFALLPGCRQVQTPASEPFGGPTYGDAFWSHWGDGQAEIDSYDLTMPRYGAPRGGTAVAIYVTETFDPEQRVKANSGEGLPVLKFNLIEDFQTGIYDYNWMTSAFAALERFEGRQAGSPAKITFSSQEWCGQVWAEVLFDPLSARRSSHSYFEGEADIADKIAYPMDGIAEDMLWLWARGLAEPKLEPGESAKVALLPAFQRGEVRHTEVEWRPATLSRGSSSEQVEVPAGAFEVERWTLSADDGFSRTFLVEAAAPHRIVSWETSEGEKAQLIKSERMKYWEMNSPEHDGAVERLGLTKRPARTM